MQIFIRRLIASVYTLDFVGKITLTISQCNNGRFSQSSCKIFNDINEKDCKNELLGSSVLEKNKQKLRLFLSKRQKTS